MARSHIALIVPALLLAAALRPQHVRAQSAPAIVPRPASMTAGTGAFTLTGATIVLADAPFQAVGHQLADALAPATGFNLEVRSGAAPKTPHIALTQQKTLAGTLGDEGYKLEVTPRGITLAAAAPAGAFYGMQTLRQENATVMSWRGLEGAIAAARTGHDTVLTPTSHTYFDYYQAKNQNAEPLAIGGFLPLDKVYTWEPMPETIEPQFQKHVLGVQGQLWTEYLPSAKAVEYMAFPRLIALAEVAWTPTAQRKFDDFRARLGPHLDRLRILDVNFRPLDQ